jgi:type I restriction enzyme S subunit
MSEWRETDIGLVPHDWNVVRFKELLQIPLKNGVNKPSRVRGIGDYKMVNMNEIFAHDVIKDIPMEFVELNDNEQSTSLLEKNDLLFARQSLVFEGAGKCSIYTGNNEKVCFEGHLIRARINSKKSNPEFYYYFFSSSYGKRFIRTITEQAVVAGIRGSDLKELRIPYPPKQQQDGAVDILSCLDRKIENLRKQNETLEAIAQTLFKHWFVDFEFPNADGKPYKSSGGSMEPSELGDIPAAWRVGKLGEIYKTTSGGTPSRKEPDYYAEKGYLWVKSKELYSNFILHTEEKITPLGLKNSGSSGFRVINPANT